MVPEGTVLKEKALAERTLPADGKRRAVIVGKPDADLALRHSLSQGDNER